MGKAHATFLSPPEYAAWDTFVAQTAGGSVYSRSDYLAVLSASVGAGFRIAVVFRGDRIVAGIGLFETRHKHGIQVRSRLLLYYNGPVLEEVQSKNPHQRTAKTLESLGLLEDLIAQSGYGRVIMNSRHLLADCRLFLEKGWRVTPSYSYLVDIRNPEELWNRVDHNLRRLIKRCRENDFVFESGDDFDSFFRLHARTAERKGSPLYLPAGPFAEYFQQLRDKDLCRLFLVRNREGQTVAAQLVLLGHPTTHTVCAGADPDYVNAGVNPFLRWKAFEALAAEGYEANDLTDAALNAVTRFKAQLGGDLVHNHVLARELSPRFLAAGLKDELEARARQIFHHVNKGRPQ